MNQQVLNTINKYKMFEQGDRVVVAVSGGPDSMALLYSLKELNARLCLSLCVAHLDHGIRKNSSKDHAFVKKTAQSLGLPFYGKALDWKHIKRAGSLEEQLRRLRYDFLLKAAKKFRSKKIALAHHRDDQAETVLMRLLRGSGLYGMAAILPKRIIDGHVIVRPLLEVSRKDILKYLKAERVGFRIDETNFEDRFFRNKIRNRLLPVLEKDYNANIREVLSYFASSAGADYDFLSRQADAFLKKNLKEKNSVLSIPLARFKKLDIALRRLVIRDLVCRLKGDLRLVTFQHAQEVEELLFFRPQLSQVHLPGRIIVSKTSSTLDIFLRKA
ncbi:MAG: tRNA lysidine(34) synthetase TilS [Candidatus Omnitrophica bacterium]|nr:tRNA lysidine(34) synthetase TilS [Candidatus Omnitrophota bacterium]